MIEPPAQPLKRVRFPPQRLEAAALWRDDERVSFSAHEFSPAELTDQLEADRRADSYLLFRDAASNQRILSLSGRSELTVGRLAVSDLSLDWDGEVSRAHARLERIGDQWTVLDDGISRNGTFVNGARVLGRRRLADGDVLRFGQTEVLYRNPLEAGGETSPSADRSRLAGLSPAQRRVLVALCAPLASPGPGAAPPSNREIAEQLCLSVEAVRTHLKALFELLEVPDLPQNRKRAELARRALCAGVVVPGELRAQRPGN